MDGGSPIIPTADDAYPLLPEEKEIQDLLIQVWNKFIKLEQTHPTHVTDVASSIHGIQRIIGMRVLKRLFPNIWPPIKNETINMSHIENKDEDGDRKYDAG